MSTTQPIRDKNDIERLKNYFYDKGEIRNYSLVAFGINVPLRISDILRLRWESVYDEKNKHFFRHIRVNEAKTDKLNFIAMNENARDALDILRTAEGHECSDYIFRAYEYSDRPLNRVTVYLILKNAAEALGLEGIGCHSLRKTFGYHAWKSGVHPALVMEIYNHSSLQVTKRYLGITQDDKDDVMDIVNL